MLTSYDHHGPIVRPRIEKLWTWVDPLGFRQDFRYDFEMELFDAVETESLATVEIDGKVLKNGSTYNDYYGFGTSIKEATKDAEEFASDFAGASVDVIVRATMETKTAFHDSEKEPFYVGSVRCFYAPMSWRKADDESPMRSVRTFEVWKNGEEGKDAVEFRNLIARLKAEDAAGERRKGDLR
jgi:hypothetical protein